MSPYDTSDGRNPCACGCGKVMIENVDKCYDEHVVKDLQTKLYEIKKLVDGELVFSGLAGPKRVRQRGYLARISEIAGIK